MSANENIQMVSHKIDDTMKLSPPQKEPQMAMLCPKLCACVSFPKARLADAADDNADANSPETQRKQVVMHVSCQFEEPRV